jgi:polyhydroxybutyrate depolymerase
VGVPGGLAALAALIALSACAHPAPAAPPPRPQAAAAIAEPDPGCQQPATAGTTTVTLRVGGRDRLARLHIPLGYTPEHDLPLVVDLHGSGSTAAGQESVSRMSGTADARHFVVVYPQANRRSGAGYAWNVPGTPTWQAAGPDEAAFVKQLVAQVSGRYCVDARRVFAVGFSGGAREASELVCQPGRLFAALAAVGGLRAPAPCPAGPVPVLAIHGSADVQNPYGGHGAPYWTYSVPEAARRWAVHDGCPAGPVVSTIAGGTLTAYRDCPDSTGVELYTLLGKGHQWPGAHPGDLPANDVIWRFFEDHPRPRDLSRQ